MRDQGLKGPNCAKVVKAVEEAELIPTGFSLARLVKYVVDYVRAISNAESLEGGLQIDPVTGMPIGITGKISLREPSAKNSKAGLVSIDEIYEAANKGLEDNGVIFWVILDRLDVAFAEDEELETQALRALFKFYLDTKESKNIVTKIFLRSDIWQNISEHGFREGSHIERALEIEWSDEDLTNLVVKRVLSNEEICKFYGVDRKEVLSDFQSQSDFLKRVFPSQVETGSNKPTTFDWMLTRTKSSKEPSAPRELIHFLTELRNVQINRLERGERPPSDGRLFDQSSFKEALPAVSQVRLEQTLYSEYPKLRKLIEALKGEKATQTVGSLGRIWRVDNAQVHDSASKLEKIGLFERVGPSTNPSWRVRFLYRPALELVEGSADE